MPKLFKYIMLLILTGSLFACSNYNEYSQLMEIPQEQYQDIVLILDSGCSTCKSDFYTYINNKWPEKTALVIRGRISQNTSYFHEEMLKKQFIFYDSLDYSFELGLTEKNTEMTLIKSGKISHYSFLEYQNLIAKLEKLKANN